jgi:hypothetical protein
VIVKRKIMAGGDLKLVCLIDGKNVRTGSVDDAFAPR